MYSGLIYLENIGFVRYGLNPFYFYSHPGCIQMNCVKIWWRLIFKMKRDFESLRRETIKAAKDLCYDNSVIADLRRVSTSGELSRIMCNARKRRE